MRDRVFTEEHRESLSVNWNRTLLTCPHCGLATYPPQYGRWHGDLCRRKRQIEHRRARSRNETWMDLDQQNEQSGHGETRDQQRPIPKSKPNRRPPAAIRALTKPSDIVLLLGRDARRGPTASRRLVAAAHRQVQTPLLFDRPRRFLGLIQSATLWTTGISRDCHPR
jgi:hypothetical protein